MALTTLQLWTQNTLAEVKASFISIAQSAGLPVTSWTPGEPSERVIEIVPRVLDQFLSYIIAAAARRFFLDQATDPGDPGNPNTVEGPGWLSVLGEGWYGVVRAGATFATTTISVTNNTLAPVYPRPGELQFQNAVAQDDGGSATYTSTEDDSIYTNPDGSVTIAAGATVDIPVQADIVGIYSNANSGDISIVVTGTFGSLACTNANDVTARARELAADYRARCRRASSRVATGAPAVLYEYAATTGADGEPLQRHDGTGEVSITKVFVDDGITLAGGVTVYLANNQAAPAAVDVESADANITGIPTGDITNPIGVVPGVVTYATDSATPLSVNVVGTAKIKAVDAGGLSAAELQEKITIALGSYFDTFPIGGLDQVSGAGKLYTNDMEGIARDAWPGIYAVDITTPAGAFTALALGEVAALDSDPDADWTVSVV
jgi:hypothetical protein